MNKSNEILLECRNIVKTFGSTIALKGVSFDIKRGEIHGLIGENGSGKSTVSSIIAGMQPADSGDMLAKGEKYAPLTMLEAQKKGIAMIVQEMGTIPDITVANNIFLGKEQNFSKGMVFSNAKMNAAADEFLRTLGMDDLKGRENISDLNAEKRKLVEIARAMYDDPDILIVDETTTALSQKGRDIVYDIMHKMAENDKAVIFISHDLEELMSICTCVTVLRDGEYIKTLEKDEITIPGMRELMVGREFSDHYYRTDMDDSCEEEIAVKLDRVTGGIVEEFSLDIHKGEIVGIAGLSECGMHEIGRITYGILPTLTGSVSVPSTGSVIRSIQDAKKCKMAYVSKNRDAEAIILNASIQDNINLPSYSKIEKKGYISKRAEKAFAEKEADKLKIKCSSVEQFVRDLSGGNKQKVVFAKWLGNESDIFIMDCPTRGIDVGVKAAMYDLMYEMKKQGKAILLISEELSELIGMSDRIIVVKDGKQTAEIRRSETPTEKKIIQYMI